jgi:hypothetical protein
VKQPRTPNFDDHTWARRTAPFTNLYRSLAMIFLRGKIEVTDPSGLAGEVGAALAK